MDVDILENEVIAYLHRNDIRDLKKKHRINENIVTSLKEESTTVTIDYDGGETKEEDVFDDVLDALEEIDTMLWELSTGKSSFEDIEDDYEWEKVMKTYEYYDEIRSQYE